MVDVPLDSLIARADLVVRGTVLRTGTRVKMEQGLLQPRTHTWIAIDEILAGSTSNAVVHLWESGGRYQGVETQVSGTPHYGVGEEVVVFLVHDPEQPGSYRTLEMVQGKYRVLKAAGAGERLAVRDLSDVAMAKWRRNRIEISAAPEQKPISVEMLKARVRALRLTAPGKGVQR